MLREPRDRRAEHAFDAEAIGQRLAQAHPVEAVMVVEACAVDRRVDGARDVLARARDEARPQLAEGIGSGAGIVAYPAPLVSAVKCF